MGLRALGGGYYGYLNQNYADPLTRYFGLADHDYPVLGSNWACVGG